MDVKLRSGSRSDAVLCGRIVYDAFRDIADRHGFPPSFESLEAATRVVRLFLDIPAIFSLMAEQDGQVVGAIFLDEGDEIHGIALVAVNPPMQQCGIGRRLMEAVLERARARGAPGVRLVQEAYNMPSMALYASLGFEVKEPLVRVKGKSRSVPPPGVQIRALRPEDLDECARLCARVHGFARTVDLRDGVELFSPFAAMRGGRMTAYTYVVFGRSLAWGVAETEADMRELIAGIGTATGPPLTFLVPIRQGSFFRWCLSEGFRVEKPMTLMAIGEYQEPRGCYFPSGIY
ncbi:MAG: GNAT family N-acetyltransferase [Anaerolineae bacterium]